MEKAMRVTGADVRRGLWIRSASDWTQQWGTMNALLYLKYDIESIEEEAVRVQRLSLSQGYTQSVDRSHLIEHSSKCTHYGTAQCNLCCIFHH